MSYFVRTGPSTYRATEHTGGAWQTTEQHIAPSLGLIAHCIETDRDARRDDGLLLSRLSYDILGVVPIDEVEITVDVLRPGRTIELVEARMAHAGRDAVRVRAWMLQPRDTAELAGTGEPTLPGPDDLPAWDPTTTWPGGFIRGVEIRRDLDEPGRGRFWARTQTPLVDDADASPTARTIGLIDIANGMVVRADPTAVAFPNVDLTVHLHRAPVGGWLGFDTRVTFGTSGLGLTASTLHDAAGPLGTVAQSLTVRPV